MIQSFVTCNDIIIWNLGFRRSYDVGYFFFRQCPAALQNPVDRGFMIFKQCICIFLYFSPMCVFCRREHWEWVRSCWTLGVSLNSVSDHHRSISLLYLTTKSPNVIKLSWAIALGQENLPYQCLYLILPPPPPPPHTHTHPVGTFTSLFFDRSPQSPAENMARAVWRKRVGFT